MVIQTNRSHGEFPNLKFKVNHDSKVIRTYMVSASCSRGKNFKTANVGSQPYSRYNQEVLRYTT